MSKDIVIGGIGPTSTMVEWVTTEMMLNLEVMKKFLEELPRMVGVNNGWWVLTILLRNFQDKIALCHFHPNYIALCPHFQTN